MSTTDYAEVAGLSPKQRKLLDRATTLARSYSFKSDYLGRPKAAQRSANRLSNVNAKLASMGLGTVEPGPLSDAELNQMLLRKSMRGPKGAATAQILSQQEAERKAEENVQASLGMIDEARGRVAEGPYDQVLAWAKAQLANPEAIDEKTQNLIESGIHHEANKASANFEQRLRSELGARGLPGTPGMSGAGIRKLGGFEKDLSSAKAAEIAKTRIGRVLANKEYAQGIAKLAAALASGDPEIQLLLQKAGLRSGAPFTFGGKGYADMGAFLAAEAASENPYELELKDMVWPTSKPAVNNFSAFMQKLVSSYLGGMGGGMTAGALNRSGTTTTTPGGASGGPSTGYNPWYDPDYPDNRPGGGGTWA